MTKKKRVVPPMKYCDLLWSIIIRAPGACELAGKDHLDCGGALQGMHIEERTSYELRHKLWNGLPGCQSHHFYYTHREQLWRELCERYYPGRLTLNEKVEKHLKLNYYEIAEDLKRELIGLAQNGLLKHEYSKADQKLIDSLIGG